METAKELAYKAYCHNNVDLLTGNPKDKDDQLKTKFENWWSKHYHGDNYQMGLNPEHNVYIDGKRYIKAE